MNENAERIRAGKLNQRGCKRGQYVMARKGDKGSYSKSNVRIITNTENQNEAFIGKEKRADVGCYKSKNKFN